MTTVRPLPSRRTAAIAQQHSDSYTQSDVLRQRPTVKSLLLRAWRDVPFPGWLRHVFLRLLNPSFMIGAMALIQDEHGRILILEHTYRPEVPWGLPGGWLKRWESPEDGLAREVLEETGLRVSVDRLLAADFFRGQQFNVLYACRIVSGKYTATDETSSARWATLSDLPELLPNQLLLLQKAGVIH
jgi:ADP-ribose pyrophosphatase YjhB (NUDIX family)